MRRLVGATFLHLVFYGVVAVALAFTPYLHRLHTSDSLIPVLTSLYAWEPYYWEQDRVGMIWPLLAAPIENPFTNLIAQSAAVAFCTLAVPLLLGLLLFPRPAAAPLAAGLANFWALAAYPEIHAQCHFVTSYHATALALGCTGLLLLTPDGGRMRTVAAGLLLVAAHWVYVAIGLFLVPVAVLRGWVNPGSRNGGWLLRPLTDPVSRAGVLLSVGALFVGSGAMFWDGARHSHRFRTFAETLPASQWPASAGRLVEVSANLPGSDVWLGGLGVAGLVGFAACVVLRQRAGWAIPVALGLVAAGAVEFAVMATRGCTAQNLHHPRYVLGLFTAIHLAVAVLVVAPLGQWITGRGRWVVLVGVVTGFAVVVPVRYGVPSVGSVRAVHQELFGRYTEDIVAADADILAGDYWTVWPTVLHVNTVRYERGLPPILGVAPRCLPWLSRWVAPARPLRVVVPAGESGEARQHCETYRFSPFTPAGNLGSVELYLTTPVP